MQNAGVTNNTLLRLIEDKTTGGGISVPSSDYQAYAYYGSTNNLQTVTYKTGGSGGTTVAVVTYAYAGSGVANDDKLVSVTRT